jgi:integrase/recombinase XerD
MDDVNRFFTLRDIEGVSYKWLSKCKRWVIRYLDFVGWKIDEDKTYNYFKRLKDKYSQATYRKRAYQIKKYLTYLKIDWADDIKLPPEPNCIVKSISQNDILNTLQYFKDSTHYLQIKALVYLGMSSGLRAEELYQLKPNDIDLEQSCIRVNHNPKNGQSTKTKQSRISFFTNDAKEIFEEYLNYFQRNDDLKKLFSHSHISRLFKDAPIHVKELRKFFSQEWDRRGGPTSIKKILMGHSLKGDVDLMHYNCQSEEDLKKIYDKVMGENNII